MTTPRASFGSGELMDISPDRRTSAIRRVATRAARLASRRKLSVTQPRVSRNRSRASKTRRSTSARRLRSSLAIRMISCSTSRLMRGGLAPDMPSRRRTCEREACGTTPGWSQAGQGSRRRREPCSPADARSRRASLARRLTDSAPLAFGAHFGRCRNCNGHGRERKTARVRSCSPYAASYGGWRLNLHHGLGAARPCANAGPRLAWKWSTWSFSARRNERSPNSVPPSERR